MKFKPFRIRSSVQMVVCQSVFLRNSTMLPSHSPLRVSSLRSKKDTRAVITPRPAKLESFESKAVRAFSLRTGRAGVSKCGTFFPKFRPVCGRIRTGRAPPPGRNADKLRRWVDADGDVCTPVTGFELAFVVVTIMAGCAVWIGVLLAVISKF